MYIDSHKPLPLSSHLLHQAETALVKKSKNFYIGGVGCSPSLKQEVYLCSSWMYGNAARRKAGSIGEMERWSKQKEELVIHLQSGVRHDVILHVEHKCMRKVGLKVKGCVGWRRRVGEKWFYREGNPLKLSSVNHSFHSPFQH